jgi:GxxExxY protein
MRGMRGMEGELTGRVIGCIIEVHRTLGPGFLEAIYRRALHIELGRCGISAEAERGVVVRYHGEVVGRHRMDLVVEGRLVLELKAVVALNRAHYAQLRSCLKAARLEYGLLVNFAGERADFRRVECGPAAATILASAVETAVVSRQPTR